MNRDFRCSAASLARPEALAGSASTSRGYLLLECPGPWGVNALTDSRLPEETVGPVVARARRLGLRMLLIRRPGRPTPSPVTTVYAARAAGPSSWLETARLEDLRELAAVDLDGLAAGRGAGLGRTEEDVYLVCAHGRHDVCCAELGRPVAAALAERHPGQTWEASHVGGDRFAANLVVLPEGLYYGRVTAQSALAVVDGHQSGRLDLDLLRGRSNVAFPVQAAEIALRRHLDAPGRHALRLRRRTVDGEVTTAVFGHGEDLWEVRVSSALSGQRRLTCRAERPSRAWEHRVLGIEHLSE